MFGATQPPQSEEQRRILELDRDNPDATPKDILDMLDDPHLTVDYVQRIIHDFELPKEQPSNPDAQDIMATANDTTDDDPDEQTESLPDPTSSHRPLDTLGEKSRKVIETIRDDPELSLTEVYDIRDDCSRGHVRNSIKKYSQHIPTDAAIWDDVTRPETITDIDDIGAKSKRLIVQAISDNANASKKEVADMAGVRKTQVTDAMQMYQHLLPAKWCRRFPSLSDGETLPRGDGEECALGPGTTKAEGESEGEESESTTISPDIATDTAEAAEPTDADGEIRVSTEPSDATVGTFQAHDDPEDERERLINLNDIGLLGDEELDQRLSQLDELIDEDGDGEDGTVTADEDGRPGIDASWQTPPWAGDDAEAAPAGADDAADLRPPQPKEVIAVDPDDRDQLEDEVELLRDSGEELSGYAKGIQHALTVLGVDSA